MLRNSKRAGTAAGVVTAFALAWVGTHAVLTNRHSGEEQSRGDAVSGPLNTPGRSLAGHKEQQRLQFESPTKGLGPPSAQADPIALPPSSPMEQDLLRADHKSARYLQEFRTKVTMAVFQRARSAMPQCPGLETRDLSVVRIEAEVCSRNKGSIEITSFGHAMVESGAPVADAALSCLVNVLSRQTPVRLAATNPDDMPNYEGLLFVRIQVQQPIRSQSLSRVSPAAP
jgi:hypothetical protein